MKLPNPRADKFIDKRRKIQQIGELRREKMIVMKVGERRAPDENQTDQFHQEAKK